MLSRKLSNVIVGLVCVVWAVDFFARFFIASYEPSPAINSIFGAIVGGALFLGRNHDRTDSGDTPPFIIRALGLDKYLEKPNGKPPGGTNVGFIRSCVRLLGMPFRLVDS